MEKDPFKKYLKESEPDKAEQRLCVEYSNRTSGGRWTQTHQIFN